MSFELIQFNSGIIEKQAADELLQNNGYTARFGLVLTQPEALQLAKTRADALKDTGRIEFGGGVTSKLIKAFCDSPYVSQYNYAQIIGDLLEAFYEYKNETLDLASDDEIVEFMEERFNGVCQGSLELLCGRELYLFARNLRFGQSDSAEEDMNEQVCEEEEIDE